MTFGWHYVEWRLNRVTAIIEWFGADWFRGRRILELGAGHGEIGMHFMALGADVVFTEGRREHLDELRVSLPLLDDAHAFQLDAETMLLPPNMRPFDLVLHQGLLYHLNDWRKSLHACAAISRFMALESEVCDSDDPTFELKVDEGPGGDQALHRTGTRPSAEMVEGVLADAGWRFQRIMDNRCNSTPSPRSGGHFYDWPVTNKRNWKGGHRRWWFCGRESVKP